LSQLQQQGYPVLPGFVISSATFREFLERLNDTQTLLADFPDSSLYFDVDNPKALQLVAQQSRQAILEANLPPEWLSNLMEAAAELTSANLILRSSVCLANSIRRQLSGLLPAQISWCHPAALELNLKRTWAELFTAKSLFYWQKLGIPIEQINLGILIQPIASAIASGSAEIRTNKLYINSTLGLGHSLLKGEVLPDLYQVNLSTGAIENQQLGNKNRAYRLQVNPDATTNRETCLESYLLSQSEQENYALDRDYLAILIQLLQRLVLEQSYQGSLEWTLRLMSDTSEPQFYLTQLNPDVFYPKTSPIVTMEKTLMNEDKLLLKGLQAAPGQAIALPHIIQDINLPSIPIPEGRILVAYQFQSDWLPLLKTAVGVVTETGGITSHAAIMARELGIPAIVGARGAMEILKTEKSVLLNGDTGEIYRLGEGESRQTEKVISSSQSSLFNYPIATKLMVNLSQLESLNLIENLPIDGIGLLRSEWMFLELLSQQSLEEWLQESQSVHLVEALSQLILEFAKALAPRPVFYRSLDRKPSKFYPLSSELPISLHLAERGTYRYLLDPTLFDLELQALLQVQTLGYSNVNLILPFVRSVREFTFCRSRIEQVGLIRNPTFQLWIMAEVPSAIFLLPQYLKAGIQGIAIGSNDLTNLLLGIEREEAFLTDEFTACHPAVLEAIQQVIKFARQSGIPCSICGQAPIQYPQIIDDLVRWGITSISVEPEGISKTYQEIARAEQRLLLESARRRDLAM
jgi:pyruvate,water dikinase